jgi:hypothetical protein
VLVPARSAEAQGGLMEWLERLSGPGIFKGYTTPVKLFCYGLHKDSSTAPDQFFSSEDVRNAALGRQEFKFQPGCGRTQRNLVRIDIGAEVGYYRANNTLQYDPSVPADETDTVTAWTYAGTFDVGVHRGVDIGFGVGFMRYGGFPGDSFNRMFLQVGRFTWKPLVMFRADTPAGRYQQEFLLVRFVGRWMPDGFKAEEFGAIPGTFESGAEIQAGVSLGVDFFALFKVR